MKWLPIEAAPKDGTVILSDCGTVKFDRVWLLCDRDGNVPRCADWGTEIAEQEPRIWLPLPGLQS